ncbi:hypothetical protein Zmor_012550 [Zophobas morio]|uniref:Serpin domain-containing protein n=1 Tax=Zophobas morio TaxID=2755281 RepID=A0AA38ICI0_9CUCU|nr:hypothetical protein Zmor_012550 [Zophobas morio]
MNPENQILQANAAFTKNLYAILARKKGNVFFSPISIHAVLSMLHQGAQGDTAQVLAHTLNNPDAKSTAEGYRAVTKRLNAFKQVTLLTANKIYGVEGEAKVRSEFAKGIEENFKGEFEELKVEDAAKAAKSVNDWVAEKTQKNIKSIVNEAMFKKNLSLLVVNAIFFKGEWVSKFKENFTKDDEFFVEEKNSVGVKMMHQKGNYWYVQDEELDAQIIEIPYKGFDVKMMVILPTENDIEKLEAKLAKTDFGKLGKNSKLTDVHLYLPKFKMEETIELNNVLSEMGLKSIFDIKEANFKGIFDTTSLKDNIFVSDVVQKAFIEVNEGGTVAAAATRAAMVLGCAPTKSQPVTFKVDHPAVFMLLAAHGKDADASSILFYGRLSHPRH